MSTPWEALEGVSMADIQGQQLDEVACTNDGKPGSVVRLRTSVGTAYARLCDDCVTRCLNHGFKVWRYRIDVDGVYAEQATLP